MKTDNQQDKAIKSAQELRATHDEVMLELNPFLITRELVDVETNKIDFGQETVVYVRDDDNRLFTVRYQATVNARLVTSCKVLIDDRVWYDFDIGLASTEKEARWFLQATTALAEQRTAKSMTDYELEKQATAELAHRTFAGGPRV